MSRNLKRVPLDFDWPLDMAWKGYLNPYHAQTCKPCDGSGYSPEAKRFQDEWYGNAPFDPVAYGAAPLVLEDPIVQARAAANVDRDLIGATGYGRTAAIQAEARRLFGYWRGQWCHHLIQADVDALVDADRLYDFTRVPRTDEQRAIVRAKRAAGGNSWLPEPNGYTPTAGEINNWSLSGIGHDSLNCGICVDARCKREGVPVTCALCDGHGEVWQSDAIRQLHEAWEPIDPPTGDGFQLWEDCTEGSPYSPVFGTLDELCAWCETEATTVADHRATAAEWKEMLSPGGLVAHQDGNLFFL